MKFKHLVENGDSYTEHMGFAFVQGFSLLKAALASFVHGVLPSLLPYYSAKTVVEINKIIKARNRAGETSED